MGYDEEPLGRLIQLTAKVMREHFDEELAKVGSSLTEFLILKIARENPTVSQRQLAAWLGVESPTLTRHLDRLASDGLVRRVPHPGDRRVFFVDLTPSGHERFTAVLAQIIPLDAELREQMTPRELATLRRILNRLRDRYSKETHVRTSD
jgi:DNA-binding MarR family transcriptional regulator